MSFICPVCGFNAISNGRKINLSDQSYRTQYRCRCGNTFQTIECLAEPGQMHQGRPKKVAYTVELDPLVAFAQCSTCRRAA